MNKGIGHTIAIVIPYYGTWPAWMPFFLQSCGAHPQVEWLLFSDPPFRMPMPPNVHLMPMSLPEWERLASGKLGFPVHIRDPYKLCDFKPAFGLIFEDYLRTFDFWGYGDLDLIYGDLTGYFRGELLEQYDLFAGHAGFVPGHLAVMRNTPALRQLFMQAFGYRKIFSTPYYCGFDEILFRFRIPGPPVLQKGFNRIRIGRDLLLSRVREFLKEQGMKSLSVGRRGEEIFRPRDFSEVVRQKEQEGSLRVLRRQADLSDLVLRKKRIGEWRMKWENGVLTEECSGEEYVYFHFQLLKNSRRFRIPPFRPEAEKFYLSQEGFSYE